MAVLISADSLCVAGSQTLLEEEPQFSSGNQLSLHAGQSGLDIKGAKRLEEVSREQRYRWKIVAKDTFRSILISKGGGRG